MRMKMAFAGLLVALFVLNVLPVQATDFSGYVEAPWGTGWTWNFDERFHLNSNPIDDGNAWMWLSHHYIKNVGGVKWTEAIRLVTIILIKYYDESGTLITVTDPVELAQLVRVVNSEEMWQGGYVTWLGTVKPGESRRSNLRFWVGVSNWTVFGYNNAVWYLP